MPPVVRLGHFVQEDQQAVDAVGLIAIDMRIGLVQRSTLLLLRQLPLLLSRGLPDAGMPGMERAFQDVVELLLGVNPNLRVAVWRVVFSLGDGIAAEVLELRGGDADAADALEAGKVFLCHDCPCRSVGWDEAEFDGRCADQANEDHQGKQ